VKHTLEVYQGEALVFASDGKWLHPLFDLEGFLAEYDYDPHTLVAFDKIVGRAAALLWTRLGIGYLRAGILSEPGRAALERHGVVHEYGTLVDRIACQTEKILSDEFDPERAYAILKERAEASKGKGEEGA